MYTMPATICKHPKLLVKMKVSTMTPEKVALVTCKVCGFSVQIRGDSLTEPELKMGFIEEAQNLRLGRKNFTI